MAAACGCLNPVRWHRLQIRAALQQNLSSLGTANAGAFAVGAAAVWLLNEDKGREAAANQQEGQGGPLRQQGQLTDSHGEHHIVNWCGLMSLQRRLHPQLSKWRDPRYHIIIRGGLPR